MGAITYIKETKAEMKHVTWPARSEVALFTVTVILVSVVTALYLGVFDYLFSRALDAALGGAESSPSEVPATPALPDGPVPSGDAPSDLRSFDPGAILEGESSTNLSL